MNQQLKQCERLFDVVKEIAEKIPELEGYHFETLRDELVDLITELSARLNKRLKHSL